MLALSSSFVKTLQKLINFCAEHPWLEGVTTESLAI